MTDDAHFPTSKIESLLPCPFCGKTDPLRFWPSSEAHEDCEGPYTDGSNSLSVSVVCDASDGRGCGASSGFDPSQESAAARWNRRAALAHETKPDALTAAKELCDAAISLAGDIGLNENAWLWDKIHAFEAACCPVQPESSLKASAEWWTCEYTGPGGRCGHSNHFRRTTCWYCHHPRTSALNGSDKA